MNFWTPLHDWLVNVGHAILGFMGALMTSIAQNGGPVLIQAAEDGVLAAEASGGDGAAKRDAAVAAVIATLKDKGLPIVMNAINGAIEAAVAKMKATQTAPVTP